METWDEFIFDINSEKILVYQLAFDKDEKSLTFMALLELKAENIRDFGNQKFEPEDLTIDTENELLRVFDKVTKGIYSFNIGKLDYEKPRKYTTASRP